jgi:hypothetical protein
MRLFYLLALFFFQIAFGQADFHFADSTAQWNVLSIQANFNGPTSYYSDIYKVIKDTLVGQKMYQLVRPRSTQQLRYIIRKDSVQRVFAQLLVLQSMEHQLYDFSLRMGDSSIIQSTYGPVGCHVDSTDTVFIGKARKRLFVSYNSSGCCYWRSQDIWIEGIGAVNTSFLEPGERASEVDGADHSLICYLENQTVLFHDTSQRSCEIDTAVWERIGEPLYYAARFFPNPVTQRFVTVMMTEKDNETVQLRLFDMAGRLVLLKPLADKVSKIFLNDISKGLYLYDIISAGQKISSGKLVVE